MKTFQLRLTDIVRAGRTLSAQLGVHAISRNNLARLVHGRAQPKQETILLLVAVFNHLTGQRFRAGELFPLEPVAVTGAGQSRHAFERVDGSNVKVPISSGADRLAHAWRVRVPGETEGIGEDAFETLYVEYGALLRGVAMRRYGVPPDQAEEMVQDCFMSYLQRYTYVRDARAWLYGAVRHRCIDYLRVRGREIPLEPEHDAAIDERAELRRDGIIRQLTFSAVLARLGDKCRETLHGLYRGENQKVLAKKLSTTPGYVDQLISTCRRLAVDVFRSLKLRDK